MSPTKPKEKKKSITSVQRENYMEVTRGGCCEAKHKIRRNIWQEMNLVRCNVHPPLASFPSPRRRRQHSAAHHSANQFCVGRAQPPWRFDDSTECELTTFFFSFFLSFMFRKFFVLPLAGSRELLTAIFSLLFDSLPRVKNLLAKIYLKI